MPSVEGITTLNYFVHSPYWKAILYYSLRENFCDMFSVSHACNFSKSHVRQHPTIYVP